MALKEARRLVHALGGEQDVASVALDEPPSAEMPDREADVVPHYRREESQQGDQDDGESSSAGVDGAEDEDRLPGDGHTEILQEHEARDGEIAELVQRGLECVQNPRQVLRGRGGSEA